LAMPLLDAEHAGLLLAQVRARVAAAGFRW
jgi:hypothetical protein